ncbi:MAG: hypothetical protein H6568_13065 [Lewinellaceae bacterium]|nr:hypothetical protein [Saprospiraceae bacterium]MCB9313683.1 hypothetical protein [Lewinellaceae bacterium]HRW74449.1 hypothetical protein [Saprospiraceae bacterium]
MQHRHILIIILTGLAAFWIGSILYYQRVNTSMIGGGDTWGYYIYLPSSIISGDLLTLETAARRRAEMVPGSMNFGANRLGIMEINMTEKDLPVIKYTSGVAIMLSPFFVLAHAIAYLFEIPPDGYHPVYWYSIYLGVCLWVLFGMIILYRFLIRRFPTWAVWVSIIVLGVGTNLYFFLVYTSPMSHPLLFSLYCFLLEASERYIRNQRTRTAGIIGLICGMITLIRPTEIIAVSIPLILIIYSISSYIRSGWKWQHLLIATLSFCIPIIPQLIYWKMASGEWLYYSYGGEGFDFLNPHIFSGLFGFMNGWFIYTPIYLLAIPGFVPLYIHFRKYFWPVLIFIILHVYIIYSWHNWYYINSFGSRPMVEALPLLAIPWTAFITKCQTNISRSIVIGVSVLCILLNIFQTWQVSQAILLSEEGSFDYYVSIFGKRELNEKRLIAADTQTYPPDFNTLDSIGVIGERRAEFPDSTGTVQQTNEGTMFRISNQTAPRIDLQLDPSIIQPGDYLRITCRAKSEGWNNDRWNMATQTISIWQNQDWLLWVWNRINNKLGNPTWNLWGGEPGVWGEAWYAIQIPKNYKSDADIKVWIENRTGPAILISSFQVELWREK